MENWEISGPYLDKSWVGELNIQKKNDKSKGKSMVIMQRYFWRDDDM